VSQTIISYRSRADFDAGDLRLILPRRSEEIFLKNLKIVDRLHQIAAKNNATPSQVTLAWILAEHPTTWISIPGCRTTERIEENAHGGEVELSDEAIREIRQLVDKAVVVGTRNRTVLDRDRSGGQLSPARPVEGRELCMTHDYIVLAIYSTSIEQGPE